MLSRLLIASAVLFSNAHAGTSLLIEHPRNPSKQKDLYSIVCEKDCQLEVKSNEPAKGHAKSELFENQIKELLNLQATNMLPKAERILGRLVLYRIEANDGTKKLNIILGYPKAYKGEEYLKYSSVISRIEDIKRTMAAEMQETK